MQHVESDRGQNQRPHSSKRNDRREAPGEFAIVVEYRPKRHEAKFMQVTRASRVTQFTVVQRMSQFCAPGHGDRPVDKKSPGTAAGAMFG